MKAALPLRKKDHESYQRHRRQLWAQILLPVIAATLLFLAAGTVATLGALRGTADVSRWAAISTIWFAVPAIFVSLIVLALLLAMIYLAGLFTGLIPTYSYRFQRVGHRVAAGAKSVAEMTRRPVLILRAMGTLIKSGVRRARERM